MKWSEEKCGGWGGGGRCQAEEGDFTVSGFSQILSDWGPDLIWLKSIMREEYVLALSIHG